VPQRERAVEQVDRAEDGATMPAARTRPGGEHGRAQVAGEAEQRQVVRRTPTRASTATIGSVMRRGTACGRERERLDARHR
jgi:hypothetical protein